MKHKRFAIILLSTLCIVAIMLVACTPSNEHTHAYSDDWTNDETSHWHASTCGHSNKVSDKAKHNFVDGICTVCGYEQGTVPHTHTFAETWTSDDNSHWHAATCEHKTEVIDKSAHTFVDGKCTVCGNMEPVPTEGLEYTLNDDGESYSVTGIGTVTETDIVIASSYQGKPVTGIGEMAFVECIYITSITIPNSITSIGDYAFSYCISLSSMTIPNSVTSIGEGSFGYCGSLTSITIPDSVTTIGECAFEYCISLSSMTIPNSITSIGDYAFAYCIRISSVIIPDSVTSIGESSFEYCGSLTSITIPDSITTIGDWAFEFCESLESVTIGKNVTSIGDFSFDNCTSLENITVDPRNTVYHSDGNCLIETATGTLILGCNNSIIPSDGSVISIGDYAFYRCSLKSITIPDSVTTIGDCAFQSCKSLESVTIGTGVTTIGGGAFAFCESLESITIGKGVTTISDLAFVSCRSLTSITIPENVTRIGFSAFEGCTSLKTAYFEHPNDWWVDIGDTSHAIDASWLSDPTIAAIQLLFRIAYWGCYRT